MKLTSSVSLLNATAVAASQPDVDLLLPLFVDAHATANLRTECGMRLPA